MKINKEIQAVLLDVIRARLGLDANSDVRIVSIQVDDEAEEIRIGLEIETSEKPSRIADGYFGLTGHVRDALGDKWSDYFPVISPSIVSSRHA